MNQKIMECLDEMFLSLETYAKSFNKKNYEPIFLSDYDKYKETFSLITKEYECSNDPECYLQEVARYIPDKMHGELLECTNRRKKEQYLMTRNLGMVSFVIPLFLYGRNDVLNQLAAQMVEAWNDHEVDMKISAATYEDIKGGFKNHMCYITTAVCESLGKADDCYELSILREYRDTYLASFAKGNALVKEYYDIAPTIVNRINKEDNSKQIYDGIYEQYLKPCISFIEEGKLDACCECYTDMVHSLQKKYMN